MNSSKILRSPVFKHLPLDPTAAQIRLFRLSSNHVPRQSSGPFSQQSLHINLAAFNINEAPNYTALSYEWGEQIDKYLKINGEPHAVRLNFWRFLAHAYFHLGEDWLWADQICIDQGSVEEKTQQVAMMGEIYQRATTVVTWLGDASIRLTNDSDSPDERDFRQIATSSYWDRLWILQEVMLAKKSTIMGVTGLIDWLAGPTNSTGPSADESSQRKSVSPTGILKMKEIARYCGAGGLKTPLTLLNALYLGLDQSCKEPLDKIFGLISVVRVDQRPTVDYSLTREALFYECLEILLLHEPRVHAGLSSDANKNSLELAVVLGEMIIGKQLDERMVADFMRRIHRRHPLRWAKLELQRIVVAQVAKSNGVDPRKVGF